MIFFPPPRSDLTVSSLTTSVQIFPSVPHSVLTQAVLLGQNHRFRSLPIESSWKVVNGQTLAEAHGGKPVGTIGVGR